MSVIVVVIFSQSTTAARTEETLLLRIFPNTCYGGMYSLDRIKEISLLQQGFCVKLNKWIRWK